MDILSRASETGARAAYLQMPVTLADHHPLSTSATAVKMMDTTDSEGLHPIWDTIITKDIQPCNDTQALKSTLPVAAENENLSCLMSCKHLPGYFYMQKIRAHRACAMRLSKAILLFSGGRPGPEQYDRRVAYRERYDEDPYGAPPYGRRPATPPVVKRCNS